MTLLDDAMEKCVILNKQTGLDDYGGFVNTWTEGAVFNAAVTFDTSIQARVAEVQGVHSLYTVTTARNVMLRYNDVFRRLSDDKLFRVTSDGDDKTTPKSAGLNMRQVTAEELTSLPN